MKTSVLLFLFATFIYSCSNSEQSKAVEQANEIQSAIKPGSVATNGDTYTMKAKIDGKEWQASSMMPPDAAGRIIGYYKEQYIGLPYSKSNLIAGKKIILGEGEAVDLSLNDGCLYTNLKGEIEITKVDDNTAEGRFFFTTVCGRTGKTVEVRDGLFRFQVNQ